MSFVEDLLRAAGASRGHASLVARSLVDANLAGYDSHGVQRVLTMLRNINQGRLQPAAQPFIRRQTPLITVVDGAWTFGQVGAHYATERAVQKAQKSGISAASALHCHHTGRMGEWAELGARAGLVTFATTATGNDLSAVLPTGGSKGALGTNPMAWAIPRGGGQPPIVADVSTGATAIGSVQLARARGAEMPSDQIVDADGNPTTNPEDYFNGGAILPMGGHKGYALSVIIELLAIAIGGGDEVPTDQHSQAFLVICLDPRAFWPAGEHEATIERIVPRITSTPPAPGVERVLLPGERSARNREERERNGIPIPERTWESLCAEAEKLGVPVPS